MVSFKVITYKLGFSLKYYKIFEVSIKDYMYYYLDYLKTLEL